MKAGLLLATLSLVAVAQAQKYELSCSKSELSIRWPSYESNSEYYVCPRLFGKQMTVTCNRGEVFTFVLQACTSPNKYIPAPGLDRLPTAAPLTSKPNKDGFLTPLEILNVPHPPVMNPSLNQLQPLPVVNMPAVPPHVMPLEVPKAPVVVVETPKHEEIKPAQKEETVVVAVVDASPKPLPPLPPTPAPAPPLVETETGKKPSVAAGKKPTANKKKSSAKPSKNGKQKPKAPKSPKKTAKKPKTPATKAPKA